VCVDALVREWLHQLLDEDAARDRISNQVAEILVRFHLNYLSRSNLATRVIQYPDWTV
jgi:hypothetical protein